jgi:ABC-2 type transport system ATP-binding protein
MVPALRIRDLHKHYGTHRALDGVDLTVQSGEVYGLLGPNGAGKTTLMKALLGLQRPTSGSIEIHGRPVGRDSLAEVGALIEVPGLWPQLTADETLRIHARLRGVPLEWIEPALERVGMTGARQRKVGAYSLGMRWRLGIAVALLARPRLIVLDEPTNGLDVLATRALREALRVLRDETGKCIVFSTHIMQEVQRLCDRVVVVAHGRHVAEGTVQGLCEQAGCEDFEDAFVKLAFGAEGDAP